MTAGVRPQPPAHAHDPFAGRGAMGAAMATVDWAATALGPVAGWPQSLRTAVDLCLASRAPMMLVWGPQHVQVYNDALAPLMGPKHPGALGTPYAQSFAEVWDVMGPLLSGVHDRGESSYLEDAPISFDRSVEDEEMFWTFSWSPVRDEGGVVAGALHPAVETTGRVLAERRLRLLHDLATSAGASTTVEQACRAAVAVLSAHPLEAPLSAVYLVDEVRGTAVPVTAHLAAAGGVLAVAEVFPTEVDLTASTFTAWPLSAAASSGRPEVATDIGVERAWLADRSSPRPVSTGVVLPLTAPGRPLPVALLAVGANPHRPLDEAQLSFLQLLAGQLGTALATAALHEEQHRVALALQRAMLPDTSRVPSALEVAARYLPSSTDAEVGGDWYDVIPLGAGRTALVVGDVMGHGVHAAAVMGQVRAAVRAYAQLDLPPGRVLELLDRLVEDVSGAQDVGQIVTCVYAVHDPGDGTLTVADAGHPPPLLLHPGGCETWEGPVGPPLGTGLVQYAEAVTALPGGSGLLLYTDGLVERRTSDVGAGIAHLLRVVDEVGAGGSEDLERLVDAALAVAPTGEDGGAHDDVALLAVRVPRTGPAPAVVVDLHAAARAARTARRAASEALGAWGVEEDAADAAVLLTAELVNNAITHTGRPRQLRLRRLPDRLVVEVSDADPRPPRRLVADTTAEGGRGLTIISALASTWGVRFEGAGKVVWCEVLLGAPTG